MSEDKEIDKETADKRFIHRGMLTLAEAFKSGIVNPSKMDALIDNLEKKLGYWDQEPR